MSHIEDMDQKKSQEYKYKVQSVFLKVCIYSNDKTLTLLFYGISRVEILKFNKIQY